MSLNLDNTDGLMPSSEDDDSNVLTLTIPKAKSGSGEADGHHTFTVKNVANGSAILALPTEPTREQIVAEALDEIFELEGCMVGMGFVPNFNI